MRDSGLDELARGCGVPFGAAQEQALAAYAELLLRWSEKINLTAARSVEKLQAEHLPDAFVLAGMLAGDEAMVDVGSGGGLPGLPLALLQPRLRLTLVEPTGKKAAFLRTAIRELGLGERVGVETRRAEVLAAEGVSFDAASARAVWAPAAWAAVGAQLVRPGGRVFVLATADPGLAMAELRVVATRSYLGGRRWLGALQRVG